jgi:hypothetical protein
METRVRKRPRFSRGPEPEALAIETGWSGSTADGGEVVVS